MWGDDSVGTAGRSIGFLPRLSVDSVASHLFFILSLIALCCAEASASDHAAGEYLTRMADALRSLSYEGTIVYLYESKLETLRIVHRVEEGQIHEQLVSLNGPVRTLTREKGGIICKFSDSHAISVQGQGGGKGMFHAWTLDPGALGDHYRVRILGTARVVGRQTEVVGIIPGDDLRYGYRFYVDRESGLPLKSDLMGQQANPIEQVMFTSLVLLESKGAIPADEGQAPRRRPSEAKSVVPDSLPWRFDSLPPGFVPVIYNEWRDAGGKPVKHILLSDGLASVSVYVESDPQEGLDGNTHIGAVHAAGKRVAGHQVTVVGEAPLVTVEAVLAGIRYGPRGRP